eukprot:TRINITY_DN62461_c0_g1_i1.p2 TRINITY_DN62461_c0_g1~~TRINITY_DN62461_c0_g1_i1.p2  ORF type:complete len:184 (+),score=33.83 TRINITY_DN62461_c0_g1_i1:3-554(+)
MAEKFHRQGCVFNSSYDGSFVGCDAGLGRDAAEHREQHNLGDNPGTAYTSLCSRGGGDSVVDGLLLDGQKGNCDKRTSCDNLSSERVAGEQDSQYFCGDDRGEDMDRTCSHSGNFSSADVGTHSAIFVDGGFVFTGVSANSSAAYGTELSLQWGAFEERFSRDDAEYNRGRAIVAGSRWLWHG